MNGEYELVWNIYEELMDRTDDTDNFLYEDIVFDRFNTMREEDYFKTSRGFLEYCSNYDDDDFQDDSDDDNELFVNQRMERVIDAWAELGYRYFYQLGDSTQALECFTREKELLDNNSSIASANWNPLVGSCAERMGDVYAYQNELEKALAMYREARNASMKDTFVVNLIVTARCMCKIGWCNPQYDPSIFRDAFQYLLNGCGKPYARDTIGKCYMYLSRSLERCKQYKVAVKYAQQARSIFTRDPLMLERLVDRCHEWIISLQRLNSDNQVNNNVPIETDCQRDLSPVTDDEMKRMLQITLNELTTEYENK